VDELTDADHLLLEGDAPSAAEPSVDRIGIVVAGMHRSGTSALVRVLNLLGVDLATDLYPARPDNPLGYWEPLRVVEAHEEFLGEIGSSFDDFFALPEGALRGEAARTLEDRLVDILEGEFGRSRRFVVKDPRLCRLVPIWVAALKRFGAAPRFVLTVRNPLEVAASLKLRNEYSSTKSLLLWLRHMLEAERHTRVFPRSIVSYDALLRDWQGTVDKIARELLLAWPRASHESHAEIEQFLSPRSRHHSFRSDELRARADVVDWVKATYAVLAAAADGEPVEEDVLDTLRGELDRADSAFGPLLAELRLAQRTQEKALLEQEAKLAEASDTVESAERDLDDRVRAQEEATAEAERLAGELRRREQALRAAEGEAASSRQEVEQLRAELAQHEQALTEARDGLQRLTSEVAERDAQLSEAESSIRALDERAGALSGESAAHHAAARRAEKEAANLRNALAARRERLAAARVAIAEHRRQRQHLSRELASRTEALSARALEIERLRSESEELRVAQRELVSRVRLLEAEKAEFGAAIAALESEADRMSEEARSNAATADELRELLAVREQAEAGLRNELTTAHARVGEVEATLAELRIRRFVRPRTKRLALSQLASWLMRPHRGGWRLLRRWRALRRAGTFDAAAYLAENPDVDASGLDPLMHYVEHGSNEGRTVVPPSSLPPPGGPAGSHLDESPPVAVTPAAAAAVPPPSEAPAVESPALAPKPAAARARRPTGGPLEPEEFGDFVVLLSRQRSGTNPLRSVLGTHPELFCFNEVFNLPDRDAAEEHLRESNFFTFLERYGDNEVRRTTPDNHERLFLDYLEYLRCLSEKRYSLFDVKYNTTHLLTRPWQEPGSPYLLELVAKHGLYVIHLTRRNYLRYILSSEKAWRSNRYTLSRDQTAYADGTRHLGVEYVVRELARCSEEDARIERQLADHDRVLTCDYAELFSPDGSALSAEFLARFAAWRGIDADFTVEPAYRKQSSLPLRDTIENYDEVADALRGGPFEYCLDDEPYYRTS
jgi:hypothetical protein